MGFFANLGKLTDMGAEMAEKSDVKGSFADMQSKMDQLNKSMAASAPQTVDPASEARRVDATATVSAVRQTGLMINFRPTVEADLMVMLPSGVPIPTTTTVMVDQLNIVRLQPGAQLPVSIDPTIPASVRINWAA